MATKTVKNVIDQLSVEKKPLDDSSQSFIELTPEEAEELAGGLDPNGICGNNKSCPTSNSGCPT